MKKMAKECTTNFIQQQRHKKNENRYLWVFALLVVLLISRVELPPVTRMNSDSYVNMFFNSVKAYVVSESSSIFCEMVCKSYYDGCDFFILWSF